MRQTFCMTYTPGLTVKTNATGKVTHITIDVEQQKELAQLLLERLAITDEADDFDTAFANAQTLEESEAIVIAAVKAHYANRN